MPTKLPEIRIRYSWLMATTVSIDLMKLHRGDEAKLEEYTFYEERTDAYRKAWATYERQILDALTSLLKLDYYLPVIDVTVAPMVPTFSTPLQVNFKYEPDQFVDVLAHELIHILISDNRQGIHLDEFITHYLPDEDGGTTSHVLVNAILKHLYLDIMKQSDRLERDIDTLKHLPKYQRAWEIVESGDYNQIIKDMCRYIEEQKS